MSSVRIAVILGLALGMAAPAAYAQLTRPQPFADTNRDGKVSKVEYQTSRRDFFMKADVNKNGELTRTEWNSLADTVRSGLELDGVQGGDNIGKGGWWEAIDADKNGLVTPAEIDAMTAHRFARFDANHDGVIDKAEAQSAGRMAMKGK